MEDYISIQIDGYCQPKQRTKWNFVTPPETRAYELTVKTQAKVAMKGNPPLLGPIGVLIDIECAIPKSWSQKKKMFAADGSLRPTHCDIDNQAKSILDGLNRIVFDDDRQISKLDVDRSYSAVDRVHVTVFEINGAA